jgi:hypothetical protein
LRSQHRSTDPLRQARVVIHARLQRRRPEIEREILSRINAVSGPIEDLAPEYVDSLRAAVAAALDFGLAAIECGEEQAPLIPATLLTHARVAARNGISLAAMQSRYIAGHGLLSDYLMREAEKDFAGGAVLMRLMRTQTALLDHGLTVIGEEHAREERSQVHTPEQRRVQCIQRLLNGEQLDTTSFAYDFDVHHLGIVAVGPESAQTVRDITEDLDYRRLLVPRPENMVWAWLGAHRQIDPARIASLVSEAPRMIVAIGEPNLGITGWRLTHRQARAALPLAQCRQSGMARYAEDAVLAASTKDDLLVTSLHQIFLAPLERDGQRGVKLLETLQMYFYTQRSISATASLLKLSQPTVRKRLRTIEDRLERSIGAASPELEVALRLRDLGAMMPIRSRSSTPP